MELKQLNTDKAPLPVGPYSQAVDTGSILFLSGQIAIDPVSNEVKTEWSVAKQTELCLENVSAVLQAANLSFKNVAKVSVFILDMADFAEVNSVYEKYFAESLPARSCVAVHQLPKNVKVEIEVIAVR